MRKTTKKGLAGVFDVFSKKITKAAGSPWAFTGAIGVVLLWALLGPVFGFSDTWQLVINTGTTIITFLMVFVIQQSQNKDTTAMQLKLNELIASSEKASNRLVDIEDLTEAELDKLKKFYIKLSDLAEDEDDSFCSHSIDEATRKHVEKEVEKREPKKKKAPETIERQENNTVVNIFTDPKDL